MIVHLRFLKLIYPLIIFTIFPFALSGCKGLEMKSTWTDKPITVDGNFDDWSGKPLSFFDDQEVTLGFCNDSDNLYIHFRTRNRQTAAMVRMTGLTVYFDTNGKKKKDFYLKFNDGPKREDRMGRGMEMRERPGSDSASATQREGDRMRPGGFNSEPVLMCYVKDVIVEKIIPMDGEQGPSAAYKKEGEFYSYEMSVPLKESGLRDYGLGLTPGQPVMIGLHWGGQPERPEGGEHGGFRMGGGGVDMPGGGGMPGGGMTGGGGFDDERPGGGRPGGQHRETPKEQEVWIKVLTASGPTAAEDNAGNK